MRPLRSVGGAIAAVLALATALAVQSQASGATPRERAREARQAHAQASRANFAADVEMLATAAGDVEQQALAVHALRHAPHYRVPAKILYASVVALVKHARAADPSLRPTNTSAVMGPVPEALTRHRSGAPRHRHIATTHTLLRWNGASVPDGGSGGIGMKGHHAGNTAASWRKPDGVDVEPNLPWVNHATVSDVAIRAALSRLGLPYVWAAGGPTTFDCSGLVQWAYAKAGIALGHYTGYQWNEGRRVAPSQILPGDLILFGNPTEHVGIYLGAGWMVNAPYTGQYVDVVPVETGVAGIIRP